MKFVFAFVCALLFASASNVVDLTPENFDSVVDGSKAAFVEFFAPWCGHCKNLAPEYEIVGDAFAKNPDVVVAKVDADAHSALGGRFGVSGFPTLKFFPKGNAKSPLDYEGGRTADDIVRYINEKAGTNVRIKKAPSDVVTLDSTNFDKIVLDKSKNVLVEFYAPWCGHCKKLAPDWEKLGKAFAGEESVVIAKIDADAERTIGGKYGVSGFPTLKWFGKDSKENPEAYEEGRDLETLVEFVNRKAGVKRGVDGSLDASAGRIAAVDAVAQGFATSPSADRVKKIEAACAGVSSDADKASCKIYTKYAQTAVEKGAAFLATEKARLAKMKAAGGVTIKKLDDFTIRTNIIDALN